MVKTKNQRREGSITCSHQQRRNKHIAFLKLSGLLLASSLFSPVSHAQEAFAATAFSECPTQAFLTQGKHPKTYGVNLVTGDYTVQAQTHGTTGGLNATGFNENDRFFYGWSYEHNQPARIHNDWQIEPLIGVNATDSNFFVGDVSIPENKYYVYRKGAGYGLYSIGLDPEADDYLQMQKVIDGSELFLRVYDMAFHPSDGYAYMVDATGTLYKVSASDGTYQNLGNVGERGTFGASYFDADGNLYIGRNNDGKVYRIAIDSGVYEAELFTLGPAASTNDGSRCAIAPLSDNTDTRIDFGDAPESYGTSLENNGARHGLLAEPELFLGASVDGESDGSAFPLSDDENSEQNDEDGVQFVTNIVERETAIVLVTASAPGYVNAWIDYNQNGEFDQFEQVITDRLTVAGEKAFYINVPTGVVEGDTWARFRISSTAGLEAVGGTTDGEVEDYQVSVQQQEVVVTTYPSASGWTTVAFEDNWPYMGDYDMNDLVVYLRNTLYSSDLGVSKVVIEGELAAAGASYHNGFAMRLPGVLRSQVDSNNLEFKINDIPVTGTSPLEAGRNEAIFIVANDVHDFVEAGENCTYHRTEAGCGSNIEFTFSITIPLNEPVDVDLSGVLDPFIFATDHFWHGDHFSTPPGRGYEVHLKNVAPTEAFNINLFNGIGQDASVPSNGIYYQTTTGLPWAIEVGDRWDYPQEHKEIMRAYPEFKQYAESMGRLKPDWYSKDKAEAEHIFKD